MATKVQKNMHIYKQNRISTQKMLSLLVHALVASVTTRLPLGYHSVTTLNVTEGGLQKNRLPLYEEAHFWDYLVMLVVLVALVVLDKLDCI